MGGESSDDEFHRVAKRYPRGDAQWSVDRVGLDFRREFGVENIELIAINTVMELKLLECLGRRGLRNPKKYQFLKSFKYFAC